MLPSVSALDDGERVRDECRLPTLGVLAKTRRMCDEKKGSPQTRVFVGLNPICTSKWLARVAKKTVIT